MAKRKLKVIRGSGSGSGFTGTDPAFKAQLLEAAANPVCKVSALTEVLVDRWRKVIDLKALGAITDLRRVRKSDLDREILHAVTNLLKALEKHEFVLGEVTRPKLRAKRRSSKQNTPWLSAEEVEKLFEND